MQLAGCVIKDSEGKVLLHRSTPQRVQWEIPGGKVDTGETAQQAAVRELAEELGVDVKIVRRIGGKVFEQDGEQHEYEWFEATVTSGTPHLAEPDTFDKLGYFDIDDMSDMLDELSANAKNFVAAAKSREISL